MKERKQKIFLFFCPTSASDFCCVRQTWCFNLLPKTNWDETEKETPPFEYFTWKYWKRSSETEAQGRGWLVILENLAAWTIREARSAHPREPQAESLLVTVRQAALRDICLSLRPCLSVFNLFQWSVKWQVCNFLSSLLLKGSVKIKIQKKWTDCETSL